MSAKTWFMPLLFILLTLSGCSDHNDAPPIVFTELQLTASQNPIALGFQTQLTATAFYSDGHSNTIDSTWTSLDEEIATVSTSGLVTTLTPGEVTIQASIPDGSGTFLLTVSDAIITSITVEPLFAEGPVGHNINFDAQGYFSDGSNHSLNGHPDLVWQSTDESVSVIDQETGRSETLAEGVTTITAVLNANPDLSQGDVSSNSAQLTVNPHVLQTIIISPERVIWPLGLTQQFTAEGIFSDGILRDISDDVTWSSATPGILELIVDANESGVFKGVTVGSSNVLATYNETLVSDNQALFVVEQMQIKSFTVNGTSGVDTQPIGKEVQFKAVATFTDGNSYNVSDYKQVHWQSNDPTTATVTLSGIVKGVKEGPVTIKATTDYEGVVAEKEITITPVELETIVVETVDGNGIISVTNTQQFNAFARYTDGSIDEDIETDAEFYWDVMTNIENDDHVTNDALELPIASIDELGLLTFDKVGDNPGNANTYANFKGLKSFEGMLLPMAELFLVPSSSPTEEFIGTLTKIEADTLKIKYSEVQGEYVGDYLYYAIMTHSEAVQHCEQLLYNGNDNWRLPSSDELLALWLQEDGTDDLDYFDGGWVFKKSYWSTTENTVGHNAVSLSNSTIEAADDEELYYASCVRDVL